MLYMLFFLFIPLILSVLSNYQYILEKQNTDTEDIDCNDYWLSKRQTVQNSYFCLKQTLFSSVFHQ